MFKPVFELLIEPLGLPIEWYYEYIILAVIGVIAYSIAYSKVGDMYRCGLIDARTAGSFFHWLIRFFIFAILWAITYGVIWLCKTVIANWQIILLAACVIVVATILCALGIFIFRKVKAVKKNA